jgi:Big-like domain-containing protein
MKRLFGILFLASLASASAFAQTPPVVTITAPADGAMVQRNSTVGISVEVSSDLPLTSFYIAILDEGKRKGGGTGGAELVWSCSYPYPPGPGPFFCAWPVPPSPSRTYSIYACAEDVNVSGCGEVEVTSVR